MTNTYNISNMTCMGCVNKVSQALKGLSGIDEVNINLSNGEAIVKMPTRIGIEKMQEALSQIGEYMITSERAPVLEQEVPAISETQPSDFQRLYPLFLIFAFLIGTVGLIQLLSGEWNSMKAMQHFMGGFFLVFSFFKLLDIKGFAQAFSGYDPIARQWSTYSYLYPFIELVLGIAYLSEINLFVTNIITLVIVGIGTIGVARTLLNKRQIQCACLGTVFNFPMTKVTLTENSLMILMALLMLFYAI